MIIVTGTFELPPAGLAAAQAAAIEMMRETAKEDGCIVYRFYQDIEHPHIFRVYEEWASDAHLAAHAQTPHMATFRAALQKIGLIARDVKKMEAGAAVGL